MIEKVARAIYKAFPEAIRKYEDPDIEDPMPYEELSKDGLAIGYMIAKAAIEAMKEPTEGMIFSGTSVTSVWRDIKGSQLTVNREKMRMRYTAMIEAALKE